MKGALIYLGQLGLCVLGLAAVCVLSYLGTAFFNSPYYGYALLGVFALMAVGAVWGLGDFLFRREH